MLAALHCWLSAVAALTSPVLRFTDCKSGREIILVGCMHNNPTSISLAKQTIRDCAEAGALGAVVLESCQTRWENALRVLPADSVLRSIFDNEFQAAADLAEEVDAGLALADQPIEVTCGRLAQLCKLTAVELATGQWRRVWQDIEVGWAALQPDDERQGVSSAAFMAPELLAGAPLAWMRYFFGSPALAGLLVGVGVVLSAAVGVDPLAESPPLTFGDLLPSMLLALLESVLLLRVSLVGLVEERNFVLARHIRAASMQVLTPPLALRQRGPGKDGRAVVAILGLAHLNGVQRLLTTSRVV